MNIIEAEDLVKGLPDQALFQEAQFPSGRIPQYLAVSEVQRRQDMRQRFQAAQQGQQSSVKDQILQGGIGSTGMAPEMSSMPPMAPQMPPQGGPMPPQMPPQMPPPMGMAGGGITPGGIVYMVEGGVPPGADREKLETFKRLQGLRRAAMDRGDARAAAAIEAQMSALRVSGANATIGQVLPNPNQAVSVAPVAAPVSAVAPPVSVSAPVAGPLNTSAVNPAIDPPRPQVRANNTSVPQNQRQTGPSINFSPEGIASLLQQYMAPTEISPAEKAYSELIAAQTKQGLPAAIDYTSLIKQSEDSQKEARDSARSQGISAALMQLGAGLAAGDISGGQQRAAEAVSEIMSRGRQEASAERQYGRQLQMQSAESQRQNQLSQMNFVRDNAKALADLSSASRKEAQEKFGTALTTVTSFTNSALNRASEAKIAGARISADAETQKQLNLRAFLDMAQEGVKSFSPKPLEGSDANKQENIDRYKAQRREAIRLAYNIVPPERFGLTQAEVTRLLANAFASEFE